MIEILLSIFLSIILGVILMSIWDCFDDDYDTEDYFEIDED